MDFEIMPPDVVEFRARTICRLLAYIQEETGTPGEPVEFQIVGASVTGLYALIAPLTNED